MFDIYSYSNPGPRKTNQDFYYSQIIDSNKAIACLADGVGGKVYIASSMTPMGEVEYVEPQVVTE